MDYVIRTVGTLLLCWLARCCCQGSGGSSFNLNGRQARGERGAFRRLMMDWPRPLVAELRRASCSNSVAAAVGGAVAFFPLLEARRYTVQASWYWHGKAWRDQSSPVRGPLACRTRRQFFRLPRRASFAQAIGCLLGPAEEGWICICTSTDRASTDTFRPLTDILTWSEFFLLYSPMLFFPPSSFVCQGWYKCIQVYTSR